MKIIEFDDDDRDPPSRLAPRENRGSERRMKIIDLGRDDPQVSSRKAEPPRVGKIKIREFGREPESAARPQAPWPAAPRSIKVNEFGKDEKPRLGTAQRPTGMKIVEFE